MEGDCTQNPDGWNNKGIKMKLRFVGSFFNLVF